MSDTPAVDAHDLDGFDPYGAFDLEARRVLAFLEGLDGAGWAAPTRCPEWDRLAMLAHLDATEEYHHACLDDALGALVERFLAAGVSDLDGFNRVGVEERAGREPSELIEHWAAANAETRRRFRERDGATLATMAGSYPVRWQAFHIADELATHADDMGVPVSADERAGRGAWRSAFARFALHETHPEVAPNSVDGGTRVTIAGVDHVLADDDLVAAVMGRLPADSAVPGAVAQALALMG
jgi:uncharacterized protein (TIGR03083 family)